MLKRRLYYLLKPYLPWGLRMRVRRFFARRKLAACAALWPINEALAVVPSGWPGWPGGKKFAFVLTHDVEGPEGVAKCRQLAELEMRCGFRSSFNFIPEGTYTVPAELRAWLSANGFEVGVHDLNHDGKLYDSRESFRRKAGRINHYLHEWGATGFRSGFMLHELDWIHDLDIRYDASTFDVDPFEPQPDGAGTIFPFWIEASAKEQVARDKGQTDPSSPIAQQSDEPRRSASEGGPPSSLRSGYVELPYTLPQDSTLFFVLGETSPDIWLRKLDWLAERGGMALMNVHPDYVSFGPKPPANSEFPSGYYEQLLRHVASRHAGRYWQPLATELAEWYKKTRSSGK